MVTDQAIEAQLQAEHFTEVAEIETELQLFADLNGQSAEDVVARIVEHAVDRGASDVFLSSGVDEVLVSMRRMGVVEHIGALPADLGRRALSYLRTVTQVKLDERRRPQDGRWRFPSSNPRQLDLRLNTIPTLHGESIALRLLVRDSHLLKLESLGFEGPQLNTVRNLLSSTGGLILVTGPTGSGKTTALYAFLHALHDGKRKIHTLEDPIEYAVRGLHQTQVQETYGADFHEMLRGVVRQSPDVVMIGEVRDTQTAETAVRAASSGVLVLASMHATRATSAIQSLVARGVSPYFLASSLRAVMCQRLIRTLLPSARLKLDMSHAPQMFEDVAEWLQGDEGKFVYAAQPGVKPSEAYGGRTGIFEILTMTKKLRQSLTTGDSADEMDSKILEEEMFDFHRVALLKAAKGITTFDELQRVVPILDSPLGLSE